MKSTVSVQAYWGRLDDMCFSLLVIRVDVFLREWLSFIEGKKFVRIFDGWSTESTVYRTLKGGIHFQISSRPSANKSGFLWPS